MCNMKIHMLFKINFLDKKLVSVLGGTLNLYTHLLISWTVRRVQQCTVGGI